MIVDYVVTPASTNDAKVLPLLVNEEDREVNADSAYQTPLVRTYLKNLGIKAYIQVKGTRHVVVTKKQRMENRLKSKVRCRVEHVFGLIENSLGGLYLEYINLDRITFSIGLTNLIHNLVRAGQLRPATV